MLDFNNTITSKIILLMIAVSFFLADVSYAGAYQQGGLRVPVGKERTYDRVKELEQARKQAGGSRDRSGFGFAKGSLTANEVAYEEVLRGQFDAAKEQGDYARHVINALVRIKKGSLRLRKELVTDEEARQILGYNPIDVKKFMERLREEHRKYAVRLDTRGKRAFSDRQIEHILWMRLIPISWIDELMRDGLNKTYAASSVLKWVNPREEWASRKPIRDELVRDGLNKSQATSSVLTWANPRKEWAERKLIRKELMGDGLNKSDATFSVLTWANPHKEWANRKPIRKELMEDGLNKSDATYSVLQWANPRKEWTLRKRIRKELVRGGLSKSNATSSVLKWVNPRKEWTLRKRIRKELIEGGLNKAYATSGVLKWANPLKEWASRKPIRDELVRDSLNKSDATLSVLTWANPRKEWTLRKRIREELIEEDSLSKTDATKIVIVWAHPKKRSAAIKAVLQNLRGAINLTDSQIRHLLVDHNFVSMLEILQTRHGYGESRAEFSLAPLKAYEEAEAALDGTEEVVAPAEVEPATSTNLLTQPFLADMFGRRSGLGSI